MASACNRFVSRASLSSVKSAIRSNVRTSPLTKSATPTSPRVPLPSRSTSIPLRRFSLSRIGKRAVDVAAAQCGGSGENDVVPEHNIEELPSALAGAWSVGSKVT